MYLLSVVNTFGKIENQFPPLPRNGVNRHWFHKKTTFWWPNFPTFFVFTFSTHVLFHTTMDAIFSRYTALLQRLPELNDKKHTWPDGDFPRKCRPDSCRGRRGDTFYFRRFSINIKYKAKTKIKYAAQSRVHTNLTF